MIDKCLSTISGALAYDNTIMGVSIMLIIHQVINVPTMGKNLLCPPPLQIWMDDISLDDTPKVLTENPTCEMYAISRTDTNGNDLVIPFTLKGVTSFVPTRKPTPDKFATCPQLVLTYETPDWDPHSGTFQEQEEASMDNRDSCRTVP